MSSPFSAVRLRRSESFRRLTGIGVETFDALLGQLRGPWDTAQRAKAKEGGPRDTRGLEDHPLVMPVCYRCYVAQAFLGYFYRVDKSAICRAIKRAEAVIIDCTEQPIQRPQDDATQKAHYSGKKKRHALKTEYVVTRAGLIAAISKSHPGSSRDLAIRRKGAKLPKRAHIYADSACQGYDKQHRNIDFPYKKPKGGALDEDKKLDNRGLGSLRVGVEHGIGRCKRFRIVSEKYRNPCRTHHTKTSIIAGLVNIEAEFPSF